MADETNTPDPTEPTPEQMEKFRELRRKTREAYDRGEPDEAAEKELEAFVKESGIANEAPTEDFPELEDKGKP